MGPNKDFHRPKRRRIKKKNKKKITQECQDKDLESEDIWEIPSDYSSHNSEQFTSDYGSTSKDIHIQEKQELFYQIEKEEQNIQEEIKDLLKEKTK